MATTNCPHGLTNDPYPGLCNLYTDTDSNQICDLSQVATPTSVPSLGYSSSSNFDLILIAFLVIPMIIYAFTSKFKLFWNIILLVTFILTAISTFGYIFGFYNQFLNNIHLHIGTVFLSISFCHIFWHLPYWRGLVKKLK